MGEKFLDDLADEMGLYAEVTQECTCEQSFRDENVADPTCVLHAMMAAVRKDDADG